MNTSGLQTQLNTDLGICMYVLCRNLNIFWLTDKTGLIAKLTTNCNQSMEAHL